jgi:alpha-galactosidase
MAKIAFIGAGSAVFTRNLVGDVLRFPELADSTVALMDIDAERLRTAEVVTQRLAHGLGAGATVQSTLDRREALDGADYVVTSFQVGGYRPATVTDFEVPKRFGLRQTIADTLGVGGIMRGLRTIPVLLDVCRDMEELCPDALLLQYVNPMAMLCWAVAEVSSIRTVGSATRSSTRRPSSRTTSASPRTRSTITSPGSTTWRSSCASSATARTSTRRSSASSRRAACRPTTRCATR